MIDEELYRKAADELESDNRRPHIWARACALANDDHDEARYLYTNLRVEELLQEQTQAASAASTTSEPELSSEDFALEPVDFPPLRPADEQAVTSARAGLDSGEASSLPLSDDDGLIRPQSEKSSLKLELDEDDTLDLDPHDVEQINDSQAVRHSSVHGREVDDIVSEDSLPDLPPEFGKEYESAVGESPAVSLDGDALDDIIDANAPASTDEAARVSAAVERIDVSTSTSDDLFGEKAHGDTDVLSMRGANTLDATGAELDADKPRLDDDPFLSSTESFTAADSTAELVDELPDGDVPTLYRAETTEQPGTASNGLEELGWLDEEYRAERKALANPPPSQAAEDTAMTREFERQADALPGGSDSILHHEEPATRTSDSVGLTSAGGAAAYSGAAAGIGALAADKHQSRFDGLDGNGFDSSAQALNDDAPLELADKRGRTEFAVYERADAPRRAIRQGGSWTAMLFTLPWLLVRGLFGTAIVYSLLAAAVIAGLLFAGLAWLDAGDAATLWTRIATIGFALIGVVGLLIVPFHRANVWREDKLERKGYSLAAYVRARSPKRAISVLERFADGP